MGGRGFFVWGSYAALLIAVVAELVALKRARNAALKALQEENDH
jgi:heme exporter protein CcmD